MNNHSLYIRRGLIKEEIIDHKCYRTYMLFLKLLYRINAVSHNAAMNFASCFHELHL